MYRLERRFLSSDWKHILRQRAAWIGNWALLGELCYVAGDDNDLCNVNSSVSLGKLERERGGGRQNLQWQLRRV